ncbi:hypothetical protein OG417_02150 [Actinoallomurus sp. NBC_01490]|jgi:hypothetical protein|uniref:hypothetical protein n=1 Tax=Actinoallomurus sp. NBC_01490 TaxID=2903557 RepID=UPI002E34F93F|nr:hypothetical protein [Actinoallomurus sp. NBC_01490]
MPKYDESSLAEAAQSISSATDDTHEHYNPAGGSQYGSWPASTTRPAHERMSLLLLTNPDTLTYQTLDDFKPESWQVFLTKDFFTTFKTVYEAAEKAVDATSQQAGYGGHGLDRMALNAKAVEDKNITAVFNALDKTQNRGG